jgi:hypothetical protein
MTLLGNPHDYRPYNHPTFEPKETFIDRELDHRLEKMKTIKGDISKVMEAVMLTCILLGAQGRSISRENLQKIIPTIFEEAEINAASYNSRTVWVLAAVGGIASIMGGLYGAYHIPTVLNSNIAQYGLDEGLKIATPILQKISSETQSSSALGQLFTQGSNLYAESEKGPRELRNYMIQHLQVLRDQFNQSSQSAEGKLSEAERTLQQILASVHQAVSQILGNQAS